MNEEKYTREPRGTLKEGEAKEKKASVHADKLKNETSRGKAMRAKFRTGKKDNSETKLEIKKRKQLQKQGRKKIYKDAAVSAKVHHEISQANQDNNAGGDAINAGSQVAEGTERRLSNYSKKLHARKQSKEAKAQAEGSGGKEAAGASNAASREMQKKQIKREIQKRAQSEQAREAAKKTGQTVKEVGKKVKDAVVKVGEAIVTFVSENPMVLLIAGLILIVVIIISAALSSCSVMAGGGENMVIVTSFTAQDDDIRTVNAQYTDKETELQRKIANIERDYPGYDEYRYSLNEISHNPFELAALLTVLYEDYTPAEVQAKLTEICEKQYKLDLRERVEIRTKTVTRYDDVTGEPYEVEVEYEYKILNVTLTNYSVDYVARHIGLNEEQIERYEILLQTYGNKPYLFEGDPYAIQTLEYEDYQVPAEFLTDVQFGNMLHEAEKYLGMEYVWGGSSPGTGFDCSGFVSYVLNHCGNGWNVGRQTANGLMRSCTTRVSKADAKPGDLVFFQGTYATSGASHVGIYVGNGMMIHCGNPIQYASIESNYWQRHFLTFGRINQ